MDASLWRRKLVAERLNTSMLRLAPILAIGILIGPIVFGGLATVLPAFGYLPALGGETFSFHPFVDLFSTSGITVSIWLSLFTGLVTTLISLIVVMLFVSSWYGTKTFLRVQSLISPLLSVPHAAAAFGLAFLIAPSGMIIRMTSPWLTGFERPPDWLILQDPWGLAMMAGLIVKEIPFLLLVTLAALPQTTARQSGFVAASLGYGRTMGFILVSWPLVYKQIRLAVFAVIAYASSVVDVAIILGPSTPSTLSVQLTRWMNDPDISMRFLASAGALLQLATTVFAILVWVAGERLVSAFARRIRRGGRRYQSDQIVSAASLVVMSLAAIIVFLGLASLAVWSTAGFWSFPDSLPRSFNLDSWSRALPTLQRPLSISLVTGLVATLVAIALTLACLERESRTGRTGGNQALLFIYLPLIIPQVCFVFGLQIFFVWLSVDATWFALIFVHVIFVLPYVFLSLSDPWRAWDRRYLSVAAGLGTSPDRAFWRVRLPMLVKPVLVAAAVGFAVSIGQYLPTLLIGAGRLPTITTEAVSLSAGGDRRIIGIYAILQMVLPLAAFAIAAGVPSFMFRNRRDMRLAR